MDSTQELEWVRRAPRRKDSWHAKSQFHATLQKLKKFCQGELGHTLNEEVEMMLQDKEGKIRYQFLQDFADWMENQGLSGKTVTGYMSATKRYLAQEWIKLDPSLLREHVRLPMVSPIPEKPLDQGIILNLIESGKIDPRLKALILLQVSSGLRLQESLTIRMRDVELDADPPRILLSGQMTKTGEPREAYMTRQAAEAIKILRRGPDSYVFSFMEGDEPDPSKLQVQRLGLDGYRKYMAEKKAIQMLRRLVKSRFGVDERIRRDHKFHTIHFHNFRKYFGTVAANPNEGVGEDYAHALLGHSRYMGMYNQGLKDTLRGLYRDNLEKPLTIGDAPTGSIEVADLKKRIEELEAVVQKKDDYVDWLVKISDEKRKADVSALEEAQIPVMEEIISALGEKGKEVEKMWKAAREDREKRKIRRSHNLVIT